MSDAIEGADVMLYGVSLAYKESANVSGLSNLSRYTGSISLCFTMHLYALTLMLFCVSAGWVRPTVAATSKREV